MRYHNYTYNTRHHSVHETDIVPQRTSRLLSQLILNGHGAIPTTLGLWYRLEDLGRLAVLTVHQGIPDAPIWVAVVFRDTEVAAEALRKAHDISAALRLLDVFWGADVHPQVPLTRIASPGLITVLCVSRMFTISQEEILFLADFGSVIAGQWLTMMVKHQ